MGQSTTTPLFGREVELGRLRSFLDHVPEGSAALLLEGPPGIGKTALCQATVAMALERGWTVLSAQPGRAEAPLLFSALADLLDRVPSGVLTGLPVVQRRALEVALLRTDLGEAEVAPRTLSTAVLSVLRQLACAAPVLVAIDDLQWADRPSARCLGFAFRRSGPSAVGFLASARAGSRPLPVWDEGVSHSAEEVVVGPLTADAVEKMLLLRTEGDLKRRIIAKVARQSGGNPFYALEIAREAARVGADALSGPLPVPSGLRALLEARLDELPVRTRHALLCLACLDNPRTTMVDVAALGPAEEARLIEIHRAGRIRFTHPLIAGVVYDSAPPNRRRSAHRALADRTDDVEERARHMAVGAEGPDAGIAALLDDAARVAHARGSPEAAAELTDLALQLTPDSDEVRRWERMLSGAGFHFEAGELEGAQELAEKLLTAGASGLLRAEALRLLAQLRYRTGSFSQAASLALQALEVLEALGAGGDLGLSAALEMDITFFLVMGGDFPAAMPHIAAAISKARRHGLGPIEAEALACRAIFGFLNGRGVAAEDLERALLLEDPLRVTPGMLRPRHIAAQITLWARSAGESVAMFDAQRSEALEHGRENDVSPLGSYLAWALLWNGDTGGALSTATGSLRLARQLDDPFSICLSLFAVALVGAYRGDEDGARANATEAIRLSVKLNSPLLTVLASWALGLLELSLGNFAAVEAALRPVSEGLGDMSSVDPVLAIFVPDEIEALVHLGELGRAEQLLSDFERQARVVGRDWALSMAARCRALVMAGHGDVVGAATLLEATVRSPGGRELGLERARSLLVLGCLQRRARQRRSARESLQAAADAFASLSATTWEARARSELGRARSRRAPSGLTATEEAIARLAADGLTNHAIAQLRFVNVKTVEGNLSRAYRKLGVRSRAQLALALDRPAAHP